MLDGAVRVGEEAGLPLHHFPLEQAAEAHAAVENGAVGKVLIDVALSPGCSPADRTVGDRLAGSSTSVVPPTGFEPAL